MKSVLPLLAIVLLASSCSTAYKNGQTPDDVYFSPEPPAVAAHSRGGDDYVQMDRNNDREYRNNRRQQYNDPEGFYDDRYLRMKVRNRRMWSDLDYYYSNPYAYRYYDPFWGGAGYWGAYSNWNPYMAWGYQYNPYYRPNSHIIVANPRSQVYSRPRTTNLNAFNRPNAPVQHSMQTNNESYKTDRRYSQPRSFGNDIRRTFGNNDAGGGNTNSSSTPSRSSMGSSSGSSNSGSSGSSSSGGSRGGNAPVRKF